MIPQENVSRIIEIAIKSLNAVALHLPVLATFTVSFMKVEVLQRMLKYCVGDFVADIHARLYL